MYYGFHHCRHQQLRLSSGRTSLHPPFEDFLNVPTICDWQVMVVQPGRLKLDFNLSLQFRVGTRSHVNFVTSSITSSDWPSQRRHRDHLVQSCLTGRKTFEAGHLHSQNKCPSPSGSQNLHRLSTFFLKLKQLRHRQNSLQPTRDCKKCLASANTSWTDGTWSPAPGDPLTPTIELANPLAAEQASMQVHRLYHAARPRHSSRLRGSQTPQETLGLIRPPSAYLTSDDDQESPAISSAQLWICPHLVLPGLTQSGPISDVGLACVCRPRGVERQVLRRVQTGILRIM